MKKVVVGIISFVLVTVLVAAIGAAAVMSMAAKDKEILSLQEEIAGLQLELKAMDTDLAVEKGVSDLLETRLKREGKVTIKRAPQERKYSVSFCPAGGSSGSCWGGAGSFSSVSVAADGQ